MEFDFCIPEDVSEHISPALEPTLRRFLRYLRLHYELNTELFIEPVDDPAGFVLRFDSRPLKVLITCAFLEKYRHGSNLARELDYALLLPLKLNQCSIGQYVLLDEGTAELLPDS